MRLDGLLRQVEELGDLRVRVRLGDELHDLLLAWRQRFARAGVGVVHPAAHERALGRVREEGLTALDGADGGREVLVGLALEDVAGGARPERLEEVSAPGLERCTPLYFLK